MPNLLNFRVILQHLLQSFRFMTIHTDILIIGGGISGMLTARELRLAGKDVAIIDKSPAGRESSWAGGGILLPLYPWRQAQAISDLVMHSLKQYPNLNKELHDATGIDPEWRDCGMLICKNPDLEHAKRWCQQRSVAHQLTLPAGIDRLQTNFTNPIWLPEIAQIRNPRLLKSLQAYLLQLGVVFYENAEIGNIEFKDRYVNRVEAQNRGFAFNQLIVCTGAWTGGFLQDWLPTRQTPLSESIWPVKGQMLVFDAKPDTLPYMVLDGDEYLIPRRDGKILAGSTVEESGFDKTTTEEAKQKLYEFATGLLPVLKQYPASHHWAGLRPGTPHGIPYIGRHPDYENLFINAGHFRNGLVMGPASARLLADLLLGRPALVDPKPYALSR